jgi:hypothetical protein
LANRRVLSGQENQFRPQEDESGISMPGSRNVRMMSIKERVIQKQETFKSKAAPLPTIMEEEAPR